MKFSIAVYVILPFLITACALNPKYIEPDHKLHEQVEKYPQNAEQIKTYQADFEKYENFKRITEDVEKPYQVIAVKGTGWFVGPPDGLVGVGHVNYHYLHKISLSFVCGQLKFDSKKMSYKNLNWKISDTIRGEDKTNLAGKINLIIKSDTEKKFNKIDITTEKKTYSVNLETTGVVEVEPAECGE